MRRGKALVLALRVKKARREDILSRFEDAEARGLTREEVAKDLQLGLKELEVLASRSKQIKYAAE